jgi:hypothetical protein
MTGRKPRGPDRQKRTITDSGRVRLSRAGTRGGKQTAQNPAYHRDRPTKMSTVNAYTPRENTPPYRSIPPLELMPVEHSRVAAFGWLEKDQVLLVRFHAGRLRAVIGVKPATYNALMVAPSRGEYLEALCFHRGSNHRIIQVPGKP